VNIILIYFSCITLISKQYKNSQLPSLFLQTVFGAHLANTTANRMGYYYCIFVNYKFHYTIVVKAKKNTLLTRAFDILSNYAFALYGDADYPGTGFWTPKEWEAQNITDAAQVYMEMESGYRKDFSTLCKYTVSMEQFLASYPMLHKLEDEEYYKLANQFIWESDDSNADIPEFLNRVDQFVQSGGKSKKWYESDDSE